MFNDSKYPTQKQIHARLIQEVADFESNGGDGIKVIKMKKPDGLFFTMRCADNLPALKALAKKYEKNYTRKKFAKKFTIARREDIFKLCERYANEPDIFDGFYSLAYPPTD